MTTAADVSPGAVNAALATVEIVLDRAVQEKSFREQADEWSRSLATFIRRGWHVVEPQSEFVDGWHIDVVCDHLEAVSRGELRRLQIWVPPGSMKSRIVSVFWPAWEWTRQPSLRYLTASYDLDLATDFAVLSRDLILSDWYQSRWGSVFALKSDANLKRSYANDQGGRRYATSPSSGGTGRHAHRILIDDPINAKDADATSDHVLQEVIDWHDGTLSTRHADPKKGVEVIIMQRLHERDLAGHVLERGGWQVLCLPERYEPSHPFAWPDDHRSKEGELLWPQRIGESENLERAAALGAHRAAGQLQQRPAAREGSILRRSLWRYYDPALLEAEPDEVAERFPSFRRIVVSFDTSFKEKTTSDFVAGGVWGISGGDRYLLRVAHGRMSLAAAKTAMVELRAWALERWPQAALTLLVENRANGPEIIEQLRREIPGVIPDNPSVDKSLRAEACSPDFESGNVLIAGRAKSSLDDYDPGGTPAWAQALIEECSAFPNGRHDDQVDMLTMALNWARSHDTGPTTSWRPRARMSKPRKLTSVGAV